MPLVKLVFWFLIIVIFALGYQVAFGSQKKEIEYTRDFCQPKGWEIKHRIMDGKKFVAEIGTVIVGILLAFRPISNVFLYTFYTLKTRYCKLTHYPNLQGSF